MNNITKFLLFVWIYSGAICARDMYFAPLASIMNVRSDIFYHKCHDPIPFYYEKLPISPFPTDSEPIWQINLGPFIPSIFQPRQGFFAETFVVQIPQGVVCGKEGVIKIGPYFIREFLSQILCFNFSLHKVMQIDENSTQHIPGKVAVLAHPLAHIYGHWFNEVVARLILLQQSGIEYDWLYAPMNHEYMKQTYEIFGVPLHKIIDSSADTHYVQADMLIVPSFATNRAVSAKDPVYDCCAFTDFWPTWMLDIVAEKFDPIIDQNKSKYSYSSKVFISRKDAPGRQILNEDEIFALCAPLGFIRYDLSKMSIVEQAVLFRGADYVVAAHGSGLANLIFSKKGTKVLEIFQKWYDASLCYLAQAMNCQYSCVQTLPYDFTGSLTDSTYVKPLIIQHAIDTMMSDLK